MIAKNFFQKGKFYSTKFCDLETIINTVPTSILYGIRTFRFYTEDGVSYSLNFDSSEIEEAIFGIKEAILNNNYDYFDNIILNFIDSYYFSYFDFRVKLSFPEEEKQKFISICNGFKGKTWDDIVELFFMSLYEFISSGSVGDRKLVG